MSQTIKGVVTKVGNFLNKDDWSVQHVFVDGKDISVWNRPDLSGLSGKTVEIEGVTTHKTKGDLQLKGGQGDFKVLEVSAVKPLAGEVVSVGKHGQTYGPAKSPRTIDEYFEIYRKILNFVGDFYETEDAIVRATNGAMISFLRGEFVIPPKSDSSPL